MVGLSNMKISISGTHSTGKSTLLELAQKSTFFKNWILLPGITRMAKASGFKINEEGDDETQLFIASYDIQNILGYKIDNTISDRCLLDTLVYAVYLNKKGVVSEDTVKILSELWKRFQYSFDIIFYIEPEFKLVEDEIRSVNQEFQIEIKEIFDDFIRVLELSQSDIFNKFPSICRLTGTPTQRFLQMVKKITEVSSKEVVEVLRTHTL